MKKQNEVIDNLIETLKDGQEGFKQAAESVRNSALKTLFSDFSQQRSRFATALQSEARRHGETKPETSSSATGALHRGWINSNRRSPAAMNMRSWLNANGAKIRR